MGGLSGKKQKDRKQKSWENVVILHFLAEPDYCHLSSTLEFIQSQEDMAPLELAVARAHTHIHAHTLRDTALVELEVGN